MYFYPLSVKRILHQTTNDANMRADRGKIDLVRETLTRGLGVGLSYREFAHDFKHQVPTFVTYVSCVKQILKLGIQFEPSVSVAIGFMADSVWFRTIRGVNHRAGHRNALLLHDQTTWVIDMRPQTIVTLRAWCGSYSKAGIRGNSNKFRPNPSDLIVLSPDMIEAAGSGCINQG